MCPVTVKGRCSTLRWSSLNRRCQQFRIMMVAPSNCRGGRACRSPDMHPRGSLATDHAGEWNTWQGWQMRQARARERKI